MTTTAQNAAKVDEFVNNPTGSGSLENGAQQVVRRAVAAQLRVLEAEAAGNLSSEGMINLRSLAVAYATSATLVSDLSQMDIADAAFVAFRG